VNPGRPIHALVAARHQESSMSIRPWQYTLACVSLGALACDPYQRYGKGDGDLGPVDPVNFPPANLGTGGDRKFAGTGRFAELRAFVGGQPVGYFAYALPTPLATDPLRVLDAGMPYQPTPTPPAYVFDPAEGEPIPAHYGCAPPDRTYDPRLDSYRLDEQGNVFTALPQATYTPGQLPVTRYVPVVKEMKVSSAGLTCQSVKSQKVLLGKTSAVDTGNYLAWLIIDPMAQVFPLGATPANSFGLGLQRWGWFDRYLLAYLDGGYVPVTDAMVMEGMPPVAKTVKRMVPQKLYYPRSMVMDGMMMGPGRMGAGYDVLQARRGENGYSPLCQVFTYDAGMTMTVDALPKSATDIEARFNTMAAPLRPAMPPVVFCLQAKGATP
jgi:hypothetical protein